MKQPMVEGTFEGFLRADGAIGVRNHLVILPVSVCADPLAARLASAYDGTAVALSNHHGCCQIGADYSRTFRVLAGLATHPNTGAVLVIALGCEGVPAEQIVSMVEKSGRPVALVHIQKSGGSRNALEDGLEKLADLDRRMNGAVVRRTAGLADLVIGLECGGSDATSGIAANPVIGWVTDKLVEGGATVVLSETTEIIGAEHILAKRAADPSERKKLIDAVLAVENRAIAAGVDIRGSQPTPGNIAGGLTTIEEKSLGCIYKAGSAPLVEVIGYGTRPTRRGLVFMDTPGQDVESMTGMAAGGAHVMIFSTGRGSPVGFPIVPVVKITGNADTFARMAHDIDVDASRVIEGLELVGEAGEKLMNALVRTCAGELTRSEETGYTAMSILKDEITL